jgi:hypothetical protein
VLTADESGDMKVLTVHDAAHSVRGTLRPQAGERSLADELIAERRKDAAYE